MVGCILSLMIRLIGDRYFYVILVLLQYICCNILSINIYFIFINLLIFYNYDIWKINSVML